MQRTLGIETEYGITVDGHGRASDVVAESIALVRSYTQVEPPAQDSALKWDYNLEDPHQDARGFRAEELLQDTDEAEVFRPGPEPPAQFPGNQERPRPSQRRPLLQRPRPSRIFHAGMHDPARARRAGQGGRTHPRGMRPAPEPAAADGPRVRLYKNNTDFVGHSYGCHDNYLMRRDVPWDRIVRGRHPVPGHAPDLSPAPARSASRARGAAGSRASSRSRQRADFFSVWCPSTR